MKWRVFWGVRFLKIWIIYRKPESMLSPEAYEVHRLVQTCRARNIDVSVFAPEQFELLVARNDERSVRIDGAQIELSDAVLPRMGAGTTYFALAVIRQLERLRVPTFNNAVSIETVKDKLFAHQVLAQNHLPIPKTMLAKNPVDTALVGRTLGYPVVLKTLSGSQGSGVFLCEDSRRLDEILQLIRATQAHVNLILQEFIAPSKGRDFRVLVVGGRVVAGMERRAQGDCFKANFSQGGEVVRWVPDKQAEWLALESARILGLDIAGIDLLIDDGGYKICEANSSPGFEGMESCCDIDVASEIVDFLSLRMGRIFGHGPLPLGPEIKAVRAIVP